MQNRRQSQSCLFLLAAPEKNSGKFSQQKLSAYKLLSISSLLRQMCMKLSITIMASVLVLSLSRDQSSGRSWDRWCGWSWGRWWRYLMGLEDFTSKGVDFHGLYQIYDKGAKYAFERMNDKVCLLLRSRASSGKFKAFFACYHLI